MTEAQKDQWPDADRYASWVPEDDGARGYSRAFQVRFFSSMAAAAADARKDYSRGPRHYGWFKGLDDQGIAIFERKIPWNEH
jgi:hypothetical protein